MSESEAEEQAAHEQFSQQFAKDVEEAMHGLATKYMGEIQDFAVSVNWTSENHQKPYPKLLIETMRDMGAPDFDPVRQAMELNDLLSLGANSVLRNILFQVMQQANQSAQMLAVLTKAAGDPEAIEDGEPGEDVGDYPPPSLELVSKE